MFGLFCPWDIPAFLLLVAVTAIGYMRYRRLKTECNHYEKRLEARAAEKAETKDEGNNPSSDQ